MTIAIVDTSVFLNVLDVPGFNQNRNAVLEKFKTRIEAGQNLILSIAAIIETGNHIAHLNDGQLRRQYAQLFADQVTKMIEGQAPWVAARPIEACDIERWVREFPDHAMRELSLADVSIIEEYKRQRELNPNRAVEIWSLDGHLDGYGG